MIHCRHITNSWKWDGSQRMSKRVYPCVRIKSRAFVLWLSTIDDHVQILHRVCQVGESLFTEMFFRNDSFFRFCETFSLPVHHHRYNNPRGSQHRWTPGLSGKHGSRRRVQSFTLSRLKRLVGSPGLDESCIKCEWVWLRGYKARCHDALRMIGVEWVINVIRQARCRWGSMICHCHGPDGKNGDMWTSTCNDFCVNCWGSRNLQKLPTYRGA